MVLALKTPTGKAIGIIFMIPFHNFMNSKSHMLFVQQLSLYRSFTSYSMYKHDNEYSYINETQRVMVMFPFLYKFTCPSVCPFWKYFIADI